MKNNIKLSIIIPCFNAQETVKEAVHSIFAGEVSVPFEIILIDDASTDQTRRICQQLSTQYSQVHFAQHTINLGGGATRNTGARVARGNIFFFLDSDDLLDVPSLNRMLALQQKNDLDGVGVETSIKFIHPQPSETDYVTHFAYANEIIPLRALLDSSTCSLYSTFLITKEAFFSIGGYPTHHGFDTQGLAFRFLFSGKKAMTCPDTVYYHRTRLHRSYFIREYESAKLSINWLYIFEEFFYLFPDQLIDQQLQYDTINPVHATFSDNIFRVFERLTPEVFLSIEQQLKKINGPGHFSKSRFRFLKTATFFKKQGQVDQAVQAYVQSYHSERQHWLTAYNILTLNKDEKGSASHQQFDTKVLSQLQSALNTKKQISYQTPIYTFLFQLVRVKRKLLP